MSARRGRERRSKFWKRRLGVAGGIEKKSSSNVRGTKEEEQRDEQRQGRGRSGEAREGAAAGKENRVGHQTPRLVGRTSVVWRCGGGAGGADGGRGI